MTASGWSKNTQAPTAVITVAPSDSTDDTATLTWRCAHAIAPMPAASEKTASSTR